ncbi:MAG: TolC family protein [Sphingopyxis sp.]|jgi:cobalt-zinc-cadmium efflux system outer membrane protein|nr:TolC family protein [Sphingopyxis sp.]
MRRYLCGAALAPISWAIAVPALAEPITLEQAVARAIAAAPQNAADDAAVDAARGARNQAGVRPNPVVAVEAENAIGTGPYTVLGQAEITATYSQTIERGGRRQARVALAEREIGVAEAVGGVNRLNIAAQVQRAFMDVLIADAQLQIATSRLNIERAMRTEAIRRVRGYRDPLFVETAANARVLEAELAVEQIRSRRQAGLVLLASYVSADPAELQPQGDLLTIRGDGATLAAADSLLAEAEIERARAAIAVERTRATQDYTWSAGARYLRGTNDVALVAGITIPIGRYDRNEGNIARAEAERRRIEAQAEADRQNRLRRLTNLLARAEAARLRANRLVNEVYPLNTRTLAQVREGYNRGGFTFQNVQDAANAILATQMEWLEAITEYRDLLTEIDRLTGRFAAVAQLETQP